MEKLGKEVITRTSLGRFGFVGELYDARSESLSSRSLFKSSLPASAIELQDMKSMEFDYKFTENISDCFNLIKVEPELQVGILCDLITLGGSGKFLTDQKKSEKTVSCSLICKFGTVCEKFYAAWSEILKDIDLKALEDDKNTHVIAECYWGANCLLSMESVCNSETEKQEVKGHMGADMKIFRKLFTVKGEGELEKVKGSLACKNDIQIKVNADVAPEGEWPTTVEEFCRFIKEVPKLLGKVNGGKGKPLKYVMVSLSTIRKLAKVDCAIESLVVQINESFLLSTVYFFDEIAIVKRKFYDHLSEMEKYRKYIFTDDYQKGKTQLKELLVKESTLKQIIADNWASVRSGAVPLRDMIRNVEKFKTQISITGYESYLHSSRINLILPYIKNYLSKGIIYLGLGEKFSELLAQNPSSEFIVFVTSEKTRESKLGQETMDYFLTLKEQSGWSSKKFMVLDSDYGTPFFEGTIQAPACVHLKGCQILNRDLYGEYLSDLGKNFAQPKKGSKVEYVTHKPGNRVHLQMVCPNFKNNICSSDFVEWICLRCKSTIEYGFDDFFYCQCGRCLSSSFSYRCRDPKHGNVFVFPEKEFLKMMLSKLRPMKEMNILILGQSGVGKSTWINSIVNYLNYETLEDAQREGVICTIPATFTMFDPRSSTQHTVCVGEKNIEENTEIGSSGTQYSHTYTFFWEDRLVRLIDTPGLGDTRGVTQDKENLLNVITYIENLKELHGVCILFKASDNRSTGFFSYCLKELLVNLHKNVTRNIVFCFTNARSTFYSPGQVAVILEKIIGNMGVGKELPLGLHNMFCLDNESFMFLCSLKHPKIHYEDHLKASFVESWKISLKETKRLFNTIKQFQPHLLKDTLALFRARNRIYSSITPLANITKTIQINITSIKETQKKIENSKQTLQDLSKMLIFKEVQLETERLLYPRTVCTKSSCVNYVLYKSVNITEVEYKTHCHAKCYVRGVQAETVNNPGLKNCEAMIRGLCRLCGCSWEHHMHIEFTQKRVEKEVIKKSIENDMKMEESRRKEIENFLQELQSTVEEYKKEQEIIIKATVKFGMFLKQNAITVYNDSLAAYLQYLIEEEENKPRKTEADHLLLKSMKDTLKRYEEEVKIFDEVLSKAEETEKVTIEDVYKLEKELFSLKLTGESIRKNMSIYRNSLNDFYRETPIKITSKKTTERSFLSDMILKVTHLASNATKTLRSYVF